MKKKIKCSGHMMIGLLISCTNKKIIFSYVREVIHIKFHEFMTLKAPNKKLTFMPSNDTASKNFRQKNFRQITTKIFVRTCRHDEQFDKEKSIH